MSFNYNDIRAQQQASGTQWASYSDLFMVLAFIFLLMYMVSSLRTGMISVTAHAKITEVQQELKSYETIKDEYLTVGTNAQEKKIYQEIIDQIALLEDDAAVKKRRLEQASQAQAERESSLNQYQQMIVVMMNANTVAKAEAAVELSSQKQVNQDLQKTISQRSADMKSLEDQIKQETATKVALEEAHSRKSRILQSQLQGLASEYGKNKTKLTHLERELQQRATEKQALETTLVTNTSNYANRIQEFAQVQRASESELIGIEGRYKNLQSDYDSKLSELASLESDIKAGEAEIEGLAQAHEGQLKQLENNNKGLQAAYDENRNEVARLKSDLSGTRARLQHTAEDLNQAESNLVETSEELKKALQLAKNRQDVARRIKDDFDKAGISAKVNSDTGDVILDFGKDYFDTNSYKLKPGMQETIRRAIPIYAKSLFDQKSATADISSVQIIGFASPTYGGRPINPTELSAENRKAVNYNLDLSYERARSIFEYVFDTDKIKFKHQNSMLPLIKVTGRSFFTEKVDPGDTGILTQKEFCRQYNCYESQRVIIKFELTEKENT